MRTSNKILLGLLVVVFTVPLLLATTLKAKVKKGEYTVEKFENAKNERLVSGVFKPYKVVKIVSPKPDLLTCRLQASDKMDFSYYKQDNKDSVTVLNNNDTLVITYVPATPLTFNRDEDRDWERAYEVNLNLPIVNNLVVDGAVVVIDSVAATTNNISVVLKNKGAVKEGGRTKSAAGEKRVGVNSLKKDKTQQTTPSEKADVLAAANKVDFEMFKTPRIEMPDLDIKELLVYNLFYRI